MNQHHIVYFAIGLTFYTQLMSLVGMILGFLDLNQNLRYFIDFGLDLDYLDFKKAEFELDLDLGIFAKISLSQNRKHDHILE